jgi:hypothetical protein
VLHCDHINPRAAGGGDDLLNLITSCIDCNQGKSDKLLSDATIVEKKRDQLALLQERKEQIEMMMEWQLGLREIGTQAAEQVADRWCEMVDWAGLNDRGKKKLRDWLRNYSLEEVMSAMYVAFDQYVNYDDDGNMAEDSAETAFLKIGGICHLTRAQKEKPYLKQLFYIRKIVENRCSYFVKHEATEILEVAFSWGADSHRLSSIARNASSWTSWKNRTDDYIVELQKADADAVEE